jgi:hypothetical protein
MRVRLRRLGAGLLLSIVTILVASAAVAGPIHYYNELLTSDVFVGLAGDMRAQLDASIDIGDLSDIVLAGSVTPGDGLGSGYVGSNQTVTYTHRFQPADLVQTILGASLYIATVDDSFLDGRETVAITLDDQFWASGGATFSVFGGWVSASLFQTDSEAIVRVTSTRGDVNLVASLFKVVYTEQDMPGIGGGSTTAVPEPGAMALFAAGLCVVGVATRQR